MNILQNKEFGEIIGAALVFIVGIINLIVLFKNNKKSTFIGSITENRFKYIIKYRDYISAFCALAENSSNLNSFEFIKLKYDILLSLNPEYKDWDYKIINLVKDIVNCTDDNNRKSLIEDLVIINQFMLKLEWEGVHQESKKGVLTNNEKEILRNRNLVKLETFKDDENTKNQQPKTI